MEITKGGGYSPVAPPPPPIYATGDYQTTDFTYVPINIYTFSRFFISMKPVLKINNEFVLSIYLTQWFEKEL